ncbi:MAG: hypothetical protein IT178_10400, partial [Acidobacteria bacterium]|nr:hypothetical protein [Acidobacteriota bacterium]
MRFLQPEWASWLVAIPIAVAWWMFRRYARARFIRDAHLGARTRQASRLSSGWTDVAAFTLAALTLLALVFAAMRPQVQHEWQTPEFERRDLVIVLDRSVSMRATDV